MTKVIFVVCDGLGDRPIKQLKNLTPLEAAKTPNLDKLAKSGITGLLHTVYHGIRPGSDVSHLSLFGYDTKLYYKGRGMYEALGLGMKLNKGDVAFRCNLGTIKSDGIILDRRAGRIESAEPFLKELDGTQINGVRFSIKAGVMHRSALVMSGYNLSYKVSDADPHETNVKIKKAMPLDNSKEAQFTADTLNRFIDLAQQKLKANPLNKERTKKKLLEANYLLVRGAGYVEDVPSFFDKYKMSSCCIAGAGLYKGIAKALGMDVLEVKGATGTFTTDIEAKMKAAKEALKRYDFIFVHIKGTDTAGEDGNFLEKKKFIEKIDKAIKLISDLDDTLVVVTADHSTPCELKAHSADPVPILMNGPGVRVDSTKRFGERECANGALSHIVGLDVMPEIMNLLGKAQLYGD